MPCTIAGQSRSEAIQERPENQVVLIITQQKWLVFTAGEQVSTQKVLECFSVTVDELFA